MTQSTMVVGGHCSANDNDVKTDEDDDEDDDDDDDDDGDDDGCL